jgi:hypothetical protein
MHLYPAERRRAPRIHLQFPLFLRGTNDAGLEFVDLTKTLDISSTGAFVASKHRLRANQLLRITIPVSAEPVSSLIPAETPPIEARVRRTSRAGEAHLVGVEFLKALD